MARAKKKATNNKFERFSDEYFINLTMHCDQVDDYAYAEWATWCAMSEGKYIIGIKDNKYYTHKVKASDKITNIFEGKVVEDK